MTNSYPMDVAQFGVDPVRLRAFLRDMRRHPNVRFSTPLAMERLKLTEPEATRALVALAKAKWVIYLGEVEGVDRWGLGRLGIQYSMKDFLKRIPAKKAEELLEKTIEAARQFNQSRASTRISEIALFGSLARGGDTQITVGDLDLQVSIDRRGDITKRQRLTILAEETRLAPNSIYKRYQRCSWAEKAGIRHLQAVSKRLTISMHDNIGSMGCEHRIVYRFDSDTGVEIPCDRALVPADKAKQAKFNTDKEHQAPLPAVPVFRPWPEPPAQLPRHLCASRVDRDIAGYFWHRGHSIEAIAEQLSTTPLEVQAVLAHSDAGLPSPESIVMTDSPVDALAPLLLDFPDVKASINIDNYGRKGRASVYLYCRDQNAHCTASSTKFDTSGSPALAPLAEVIARAAALWRKRLRSKLPKIEVSLSFSLQNYRKDFEAKASPMKAATAFGKALNAIFDELYPKQPFKVEYDTYTARSLNLNVDLLAISLTQLGERGEDIPLPLDKIAQPAIDFKKALLGEHGDIITSLSVYRQQFEWGP